jgi:hypothetical protein
VFAEVAQGYLPMVGDESLEGSQLLLGEGSDELSDQFRYEQLFGQPGNPRRLWSLRIKLDVAQAGDKHEMALGALFEAFLESHGLSLWIGGMGPTYRTHPLIFCQIATACNLTTRVKRGTLLMGLAFSLVTVGREETSEKLDSSPEAEDA